MIRIKAKADISKISDLNSSHMLNFDIGLRWSSIPLGTYSRRGSWSKENSSNYPRRIGFDNDTFRYNLF